MSREGDFVSNGNRHNSVTQSLGSSAASASHTTRKLFLGAKITGYLTGVHPTSRGPHTRTSKELTYVGCAGTHCKPKGGPESKTGVVKGGGNNVPCQRRGSPARGRKAWRDFTVARSPQLSGSKSDHTWAHQKCQFEINPQPHQRLRKPTGSVIYKGDG